MLREPRFPTTPLDQPQPVEDSPQNWNIFQPYAPCLFWIAHFSEPFNLPFHQAGLACLLSAKPPIPQGLQSPLWQWVGTPSWHPHQSV